MPTDQDADIEDDGDDGSSGKRGRRSPNYPSLTFTDALTRARKIFDKEGRSPVLPEVAVQHLGYSKLNGASFPVIAAIKRYGLMEPVGKGKELRITDDARYVIVHTEGAERDARIAKLAMSPTLFHEVLKECQDGLGSDESLRGKLRYKWDFASDAAANTFIRALREAIKLRDAAVAMVEPNGETGADSAKEQPMTDAPVQAMKQPAALTGIVPMPPAWPPNMARAGAQVREWILGSDATMTVSIPPVLLTPKHIAKLKKYVAALEVEAQVNWDDDSEEDAP